MLKVAPSLPTHDSASIDLVKLEPRGGLQQRIDGRLFDQAGFGAQLTECCRQGHHFATLRSQEFGGHVVLFSVQ
jgi:hypothetical protein